MEFLKLVSRRSFLSGFLHVSLNIVMAVTIMLAMRITGSIVLAVALVFLSKWRVFAVRPRFWVANIQANAVDFLVGFGVVAYLWVIARAGLSDTVTWLLFLTVTLTHIAWLLWIKPRSKRVFVVLQAGIASFIGVSALFTLSYGWPASLVVLGMWLIGFITARHALSSYDESQLTFLSLVWGLVMAQIGWVAYHWTIAYNMPLVSGLSLPQAAIITTLVGFLAHKAYDSFYRHQKVRANDIILPAVFTVAVLAVMLLFFNNVTTV